MATVRNLRCVQSTELALLVTETRRFEKTTKEEWKCWIPRSQVLPGSAIKEKDEMGHLCVSDWFFHESESSEKFEDLQERRQKRNFRWVCHKPFYSAIVAEEAICDE